MHKVTVRPAAKAYLMRCNFQAGRARPELVMVLDYGFLVVCVSFTSYRLFVDYYAYSMKVSQFLKIISSDVQKT